MTAAPADPAPGASAPEASIVLRDGGDIAAAPLLSTAIRAARDGPA